MNSVTTKSISGFPLSWARTSLENPVLNKVELPFSSPTWIPTAEVPYHYSFDRLYHEHLRTLPMGFVLQSCSRQLRDFLIRQGCQAAPMGAEAVLDLPWRGKRSVRELARRGRRHGTVREITVTAEHRQKLANLMRKSPSRNGVQLKYTERAEFDDSTRCFVFETPEGKWLGAITLSTPSPKKVHTEILLRHRKAPVGIMEALITEIANRLAQEGSKQLSLGAVTPLRPQESEAILGIDRHPEELWFHSQLAFRLGRALKFAFDSDGLWQFKNKFSPRWEPLYLCASPGISWATVVGMVQAVGVFDLVRHRLQEIWPVPQSTSRSHHPRKLPPMWTCAGFMGTSKP